MRTMLVVGLLGLIALSVREAHADDTDNLRPDVLACEEALKHLVECCEGFNPKLVTCTYSHHAGMDCDGITKTSTETPSYSEDESSCIVALDCSALRAAGVCARAQRATPYTSSSCSGPNASDFCPSPYASSYESSSSSGSQPEHAHPVCP